MMMWGLKKMKSSVDYDVIIIGAGPAGLTAAIYLKRAGITPLIIEASAPGGTLNKTHKIENYPGYLDVDGTTLAFRMYSQVEALSVPFKTEKVINIEKENDKYAVITKENKYTSNYILIATGKTPRKLDAKNADSFENKGISYCAVCDGALYKGKNVAIIGGGNSAMEAASYMSDVASKVYVVNRSNVLRADEKEKEATKKENVEVLLNKKVKEVLGNTNQVTGLVLDDGKKIDVSAVFVCIGQEASLAYYQNLNLDSDNKGIIVDGTMKTNDDNVYAAGDSVSKDLYQVVTATSEGAIAATSIIKKIRKSNG